MGKGKSVKVSKTSKPNKMYYIEPHPLPPAEYITKCLAHLSSSDKLKRIGAQVRLWMMSVLVVTRKCLICGADTDNRTWGTYSPKGFDVPSEGRISIPFNLCEECREVATDDSVTSCIDSLLPYKYDFGKLMFDCCFLHDASKLTDVSYLIAGSVMMGTIMLYIAHGEVGHEDWTQLELTEEEARRVEAEVDKGVDMFMREGIALAGRRRKEAKDES